MTPVLPPPGWYDDPWPAPPGVRNIRWWDGQRWSGDVRSSAAPAAAAPWPTSGGGPPVPAGGDSVAARARRSEIPTRAVWWGLLGLLVGEIIGGITGGIAAAVTGSSTGAATTLVGEIGLWAGMLGSCLLVSHRYATGSLRDDFGLSFKTSDIGAGLGAAAIGLVLSVLVGSLFANSRFSGTNTQIITGQRHNRAGFAVVTVIVAIGAPVFEELFFRGLIRLALASRLGPIGAVWGQAALFGLAHFQPNTGLRNVSVVVAIGCLGVVLGYTAYLTGRLGAGIIAHGTFNTIVTIAVLAS
jgi:membrane protease YdiL (CAAX protease family)